MGNAEDRHERATGIWWGKKKREKKNKHPIWWAHVWICSNACVCVCEWVWFLFFFSCVSVSVQHAWWQWWRGFNANQANTRHDGREWPQPAPPHMRVSVCIVCCLIVVMHICPALISKNPLPAQLWKQSIHRRSRSIAAYFVLLIVI